MDTHLNGYAASDLNGLGTSCVHQGLRAAQHQHVYEEELAMLREMQMAQHVGMRSMPNRAHNGYTEVERLILQAHAQQQQARLVQAQVPSQATSQRQLLLPKKLSPSVEGGRRLLDVLPQMSEDDFHATASGTHLVGPDLYHGCEVSIGSSVSSPNVPSSVSELALEMDRQLSISQQQQQQPHQRMQTYAALTQPRQSLDGTHARSTTFPAKYPGARTVPYGAFESGDFSNGYGTLSINTNTIVNVNNNDTQLASLKSKQYTPNNLLRSNNNVSLSNSSNTNKISISSDGGITPRNNNNSNINSISNGKHLINANSVGFADSTGTKTLSNTLFNTSKPVGSHGSVAPSLNTTHLVPVDTLNGIKSSHIASSEESDGSSPLVSPALTYSARTPATLSPATPFSGFFGHSLETFDGPAIGVPASEGGHHVAVISSETQKMARTLPNTHSHGKLAESTKSHANVTIDNTNMNINVSAGR